MKKYFGYGNEYATREEAEAEVHVKNIDTAGMTWNGEMYHDHETGRDYWPIEEYEANENGEYSCQTEILGYKEI